MYSLDVPVPGRVGRLAEQFRPALSGFEVREELALLLKRLGSPADGTRHRVDERVRTALSGVDPFEVRVDAVDYFERPPLGEGPVVYLTVESERIHEIHDRLLAEFPPVDDVEGEAYVPHVTLGRDGDVERARELAGPVAEPVSWTVDRLVFRDGAAGERVGRLSLPP